MASGVRDLRDIPLLYVNEGEDKVTGQRKTTPETLDKIIQFLWDYQQKHNGDSPNQVVIARHTDIKNENGVGYWLNLLIDDGRLNKISGRPFRATITDHPKNIAAINRFKRILALKEKHEAEERDRIRAEQDKMRGEEQREQDKRELFAAGGGTTVSDAAEAQIVRSPISPTETLVSPDARSVQAFTDAQARVREVNREVKAMMPKLLKIADSRDMIHELIERGYIVSKQR